MWLCPPPGAPEDTSARRLRCCRSMRSQETNNPAFTGASGDPDGTRRRPLNPPGWKSSGGPRAFPSSLSPAVTGKEGIPSLQQGWVPIPALSALLPILGKSPKLSFQKVPHSVKQGMSTCPTGLWPVCKGNHKRPGLMWKENSEHNSSRRKCCKYPADSSTKLLGF